MNAHIIAVSNPQENRRIQAERRKEPREKMADLERRLAKIADLIEHSEFAADPCCPELGNGWLDHIYRLAKGTE